MIKRILKNLNILIKNIYNINKTRIMLNMPNSIKVFVGKNDIWDYKEIHIKQIIITAIKYILENDKYLNLIII